jgi:hypothetical protein
MRVVALWALDGTLPLQALPLRMVWIISEGRILIRKGRIAGLAFYEPAHNRLTAESWGILMVWRCRPFVIEAGPFVIKDANRVRGILQGPYFCESEKVASRTF